MDSHKHATFKGNILNRKGLSFTIEPVCNMWEYNIVASLEYIVITTVFLVGPFNFVRGGGGALHSKGLLL